MDAFIVAIPLFFALPAIGVLNQTMTHLNRMVNETSENEDIVELRKGQHELQLRVRLMESYFLHGQGNTTNIPTTNSTTTVPETPKRARHPEVQQHAVPTAEPPTAKKPHRSEGEEAPESQSEVQLMAEPRLTRGEGFSCKGCKCFECTFFQTKKDQIKFEETLKSRDADKITQWLVHHGLIVPPSVCSKANCGGTTFTTEISNSDHHGTVRWRCSKAKCRTGRQLRVVC